MHLWPHVFRKLFVVIVPSLILDDIPLQVQNASNLLIKPLETFRKEQIGLTKVSGLLILLHCGRTQSQIMTQAHFKLPTQAKTSPRSCVFIYLYTLHCHLCEIIEISWVRQVKSGCFTSCTTALARIENIFFIFELKNLKELQMFIYI